MSSQDLQKLVEEIVQRVLQRIEADAELSRLLKGRSAVFDKESVAAQAASGGAASTVASNQVPQKRLYTERDILEFSGKELVAAKQAIFTPSALDAARKKGIAIKKTNK